MPLAEPNLYTAIHETRPDEGVFGCKLDSKPFDETCTP